MINFVSRSANSDEFPPLDGGGRNQNTISSSYHLVPSDCFDLLRNLEFGNDHCKSGACKRKG
ncbi:hypothetical protein SDJN02_24496, partial [Cucurbita argyrosperma subsp. argyrosperma]